MRPPNRDGTPVDPVPFLVVTAMAFATCFAFGPAYLTALGAGLREAVLASGVVFLAATATGYYRLVWTVRPEMRGEVSAAVRFRRLAMLMVLALSLVVLLALPLVL